MRKANIPSLLGSPKRSATCDPGGSEGGPGFHFTSWLEITLCPSAVCAVAPAPLTTNARALTRRTETGLLIRISSDAQGNCPAARRASSNLSYRRPEDDQGRSEVFLDELRNRFWRELLEIGGG